MWSVQSDKIKQHKKRVNYNINKHTIDRFKIVARELPFSQTIVAHIATAQE